MASRTSATAKSRSEKLTCPPEPEYLQQDGHFIAPSPPPEACHSSGSIVFQDKTGKFIHWGHLKPLNVESPFQKWFFSRKQEVYLMGNGDPEHVDIRIPYPVLLLHQCSIIWNRKDEDGSVRIIDHSCDPHYGTFVNGERLVAGRPRQLFHGDKVRIKPTATIGTEDDLTFIWLQCYRNGWLPCRYSQYTWPPPQSEHWEIGQFD